MRKRGGSFFFAIGCSAGGSLVKGRAWDSVWGICAQLRTFSVALVRLGIQ